MKTIEQMAKEYWNSISDAWNHWENLDSQEKELVRKIVKRRLKRDNIQC
jgi:hypothetical protein